MESTIDNDAVNPYKSPEASVIDTTIEDGLSHVFERFSTWATIGLSVITLGIYAIYWLYSRTEQLNKHSEAPISSAFINTTVVFYVLSLIPNLNYFMEINATLIAAFGAVSVVSFVLMYVWIYKIRNRINLLLNTGKGDDSWLGPIYTFFFTIYYLQYKTNSVIDSE